MSAERKPKLAQNIQYLRKQMNISQAHLAEQLGLSRSNIASYENAKAEPSAENLLALARYFKVPVESLIAGEVTNGQPTKPGLAPSLDTVHLKLANIQLRIDAIHQDQKALLDLLRSRS